MDDTMVICDMEVSRADNIIYVYPQGHFFKQEQKYLFFNTVKEKALTVTVQLLNGTKAL